MYKRQPITPSGKIIYGILLGILTGLFRLFGANAEGVSFATVSYTHLDVYKRQGQS